jgi:hypothetical protein
MSKHSLDFTEMANAFRYPSNRNDHESTIYTNCTLHILPAAGFLVYLLFLSVFLLLSIERKLCNVSIWNLMYSKRDGKYNAFGGLSARGTLQLQCCDGIYIVGTVEMKKNTNITTYRSKWSDSRVNKCHIVANCRVYNAGKWLLL